ncbi:MAG: hypothetical protein U1F68_15845 [Gammaproteobacteria bacterium]
MATIHSLAKARKAKRQARASGKTLCANGFHQWAIAQEKPFDVQQGRLVTVYRCSRCGAQKMSAD